MLAGILHARDFCGRSIKHSTNLFLPFQHETYAARCLWDEWKELLCSQRGTDVYPGSESTDTASGG